MGVRHTRIVVSFDRVELYFKIWNIYKIMDDIEVKSTKGKYISYSQMSKTSIVYCIFVFLHNLRVTDTSPSVEVISVNISIQDLALSCLCISVFYGMLYYFNTAQTPYFKLRNRIYSKIFPTKSFIFNRQFSFLIAGSMFLLGFN